MDTNLDYLDTNCTGIDTRDPLIPHNTQVPVIIKTEEFKPFKTIAEGGSGSVGANFIVTAQTDEPVEGNLKDPITGNARIVDSGTFLRFKVLCLVKDKSGLEKHPKMPEGYKARYLRELAEYDEIFVGQGNARDIKTTADLRKGERVMANVVIEEYNGKEYNAIDKFVVV